MTGAMFDASGPQRREQIVARKAELEAGVA